MPCKFHAPWLHDACDFTNVEVTQISSVDPWSPCQFIIIQAMHLGAKRVVEFPIGIGTKLGNFMDNSPIWNTSVPGVSVPEEHQKSSQPINPCNHLVYPIQFSVFPPCVFCRSLFLGSGLHESHGKHLCRLTHGCLGRPTQGICTYTTDRAVANTINDIQIYYTLLHHAQIYHRYGDATLYIDSMEPQ